MTKFGYFLSGEELSGQQIVDGAQQAERVGFDRIWVSDHFHPWMSRQGQSPFVWTVLGGVAATTRLHMTTAVTCPTFRIHPVILAQATATLASMAPGRFSWGVGSGEALNEHILGDPWPPVSVRLARLEEALEIVRKLWNGDVVTHQGQYFTVHNAKLWTRPESPPDILMSGFGPRSTQLATRIADGWIAVRPDRDGMRTYREAGGRGRTQAGVKICWAKSASAAAETAYRLWGHEAAGGQLSQDAPMWAGFEAIYISQMGPDQEGGIRFLADEVLPLLS